PALAQQVVDALDTMLKDNVRARRLNQDGTYERLKPAQGEPPVDSQAVFVEDARRRVLKAVETFERRGAEVFEKSEEAVPAETE
ncbi:MAG TPA: hypothetical protein VHP60_06870, partial [Thermoanaerobaculia bacterium]|nr:hypothetical protein [Thermoanaerobaculia bacterium]